MAVLEPSDSPGGLIQTKASIPLMPVLEVGRTPRPAPDWLHQLPAWIRLSMRLELTYVSRSADVDFAAGRAEPPHPLREVSISMPMVELKPSAISWVRNATSKVCSST